MGSCRWALGPGQGGWPTLPALGAPAGWGARPGWLARGGHGSAPAILLRFPSRGYPWGHGAGGCSGDGQEDAPLSARCGAEGIPVPPGLCRRAGTVGTSRSGLVPELAPRATVGVRGRLPPRTTVLRGRRPPHGAGLAGVSLAALRGSGRPRRARPRWQRYVGSGGIRAACPLLPSPGISRGQRGAGSRQLPWGRKPGYFGGCGGGAVGWHCPCRVTAPGPAPLRCRDGALGSILRQLRLMELNPARGAMRTGTPRRGGDATSPGGGPRGSAARQDPGGLAALQGAPVTVGCGASSTGASSPRGLTSGTSGG